MILSGTGGNPAIAWVREDLNAALDSIRTNLEAFAGDRAQPAPLKVIQDQLERLNLTFRVMEQEGAVLLTDEMLRVVAYMLDNSDASVDDSLNAITDAVVVLPAYLDRLQAGHEDLPVLLLPTLNELRATHDEKLMSEGALFAPVLDVIVPELSGSEADHVQGNEFPGFAGSVRRQYQAGLLAWLKEQSNNALLEPMQDVCRTLYVRMARNDLRRLWWIASMVMQGLRERAIDNDLPLRRLFARLDLTLKALLEGGEEGPSKESLVALSRGLLFYAAQARPGCSATDNLRARFGLEQLIPDREALLRARGAVTGRDAELFHSIGEAVREELALVKDTLDMELRTGRIEQTQRDASKKTLGHLADTLTMLDLPVAAHAVENLLPALEATDGVTNMDLDSPLLGLAQDLLEVESVLNAHIQMLGEPVEQAESSGFKTLPPHEQRQIFGQMLEECVTTLHEVQDAIRERLDGNSEADFSTGLGLIAGAMEVAVQPLVSELTRQLDHALCAEFNAQTLESDDLPANLIPLSDAIAALELFLVGCRDDQGNGEQMLEIMHERLAGIPGSGVQAPEAPAEELPAAAAADVPEPEPVSAPAGIDATLLQIFLEEFDEVHARLEDRLMDWLDDVTDAAALTEVRRAFHTLKGSGRMVGAVELGNFAQRYEDVLNRLIEGKIEFSPPLGDALTLAAGALNALRDQLTGEASELGAAGVTELMAFARRLEAGEQPDITALSAVLPAPLMRLISDEAAARPPEEEVVEAPAAATAHAGVREAIEQLQSLHALLESQGSAAVEEESVEALGRLGEAFAARPLGQEAEVAGAVSGQLQRLRESGEALGNDAREILQLALHRFRQRLYTLESGNEDSYPLDDSALLGAIASLGAAAVVETETEPQAPSEAQAAATDRAATEKSEATIEIEEGSIVSIFLEEAVEVLERCDTLLNNWRDNLSDKKLVQNLQREIHTFKGGARMAGLEGLGTFAHAMENLFEQIAEGRVEATILSVQALEEGCDKLNLWIERIQGGAVPATDAAQARFEKQVRALHSGQELPAEDTAHAPLATPTEPAEAPHPATPVEPPKEKPGRPVPATPAAAEPAAPAPGGDIRVHRKPPAAPKTPKVPPREVRDIPDRPAAPAQDTGPGAQIRVAADLMDKLVNYAGEVSIYRARLEQQIGSVRGTLKDVNATVVRLKEQLRKLDMESEAQMMSRYQSEPSRDSSEFDPLELDRFSNMQQLSRGLSESASDLLSLHEMLDESVRTAETLLTQQSRVSSDLQAGLMQTRMTPFGSAAPRLRRIVRTAAAETGKKARLQLKMVGSSDQLDRNVLERITAPLEHMLRNAIAHGIETPKQRKKQGKPEEGSITVTVEAEATEFVIRVQDDGAGVNLDAVRRRAIERGLMGEHEALEPQQLVQFIRHSGFSTADEVTGLAGRGVGMDVVDAEIKQIGGSLDISSEPGKGTLFSIHIPFSLAVMQAIGVSVGGRLFQVPLNSVAGVARLSPAEYSELLRSDEPVYEFAGVDYPILELEPLLGEDIKPLDSDNISLLMISAGDCRAAFRVNDLKSHQEVVIKPVGPQVSSIPGILGGTIAADGQVMLILDMGPLIRRGLEIAAQPSAEVLEPAKKESRQPLVMVVDDSITMRKVTRRVLENHSLEVALAQDGVDAVEQMRDVVPDLVLLDIEMPRMDGYELLTHIRADARLRHVPVVMITSRAGQKHRKKAREAGANDYLTKPYQEGDLVEKVSELLDLPLVPGRQD